MEIRISSPVFVLRSSESLSKTRISGNPKPNFLRSSRERRSQLPIRGSRISTRIAGVDEAASAVDPVRAEITWQIVVGALGIREISLLVLLILL